MDPSIGILMVGFITILLIICAVATIVNYAFVLVTYILEGIALSAIARRRGIQKSWLAWVPVGKYWLLGAISDQYRYVTRGQICHRRTWLLWLDIIFVIGTLMINIWSRVWSARTVFSAVAQGGDPFASMDPSQIAVPGLIVLGFLVLTLVVTILQYMTYYDLFRSSDPKNSVLFLVLGIFIAYTLPFFVFSCRNQDLGMPPRTDLPDPS